MLINISEILDDPLFIQNIDVGVSNRGFDGFGNPTESVLWGTVKANVQTVSDDQLQRLPEAERYKSSRQLFTNEIELRVGDYFKYRGETFRCGADQDFQDYGYSDVIGTLYNGVEDNKEDGFQPPFKP